jgi:predicted phage replisome organizer/uncharacterized phage protein (TIGR02220 family)
MAEVKWIKVMVDLFDDEKIIMIDQFPGADTLMIVWFKLLCFAGKQNNGGVFTVAGVPHNAETLAAAFRRKPATVQRALDVFEQFGMIEIVDGVITITNWEKHQSIDGMDKIREQKRIAQEKWRSKKAEDKTPVGTGTTPTPPPDPPKPDEDSDTVAAIIAYLNEKAGTNYRTTGAKTKATIRARLAEGFTENSFRTVIDHKCGEWLCDPKMRGFLRPETLFGTKFESYLNAAALRPAQEPKKDSSFDTDEFMLAALKKSYGG